MNYRACPNLVRLFLDQAARVAQPARTVTVAAVSRTVSTSYALRESTVSATSRTVATQYVARTVRVAA